jgi:hypothetical protein
MSQNVTLFTTISPAQSLALQTLVSGGSATKAAKEAGVARETVSRWVHHDPVFLAAMQNARAELASQTRCALEALGMQAVGVLVEAVGNQFVKPWRLKAACAVLKMIGADRAETMPMTTPEEVRVAFQEREAELQERRSKLKAGEVNHTRSIEVADDSEAAVAAPLPTENQSAQPSENGDVMEPAPASTEQAASLAVSSTAHEPGEGKLYTVEEAREELINRFRRRVEERVNQQGRISARPITIAPCPADGQLCGKGQRRLRRATHPDSTACRAEGRNCVVQTLRSSEQ